MELRKYLKKYILTIFIKKLKYKYYFKNIIFYF